MSLNDKKYNFYLSQGIAPASLNNMELEWLQDNGATANSLMDCWKQFLELQGYAYGTYNDALFGYLEGLGYTGALNDMLNDYYADTPPPSVGTFTNEFTEEFS
jgi:hypothetical protein